MPDHSLQPSNELCLFTQAKRFKSQVFFDCCECPADSSNEDVATVHFLRACRPYRLQYHGPCWFEIQFLGGCDRHTWMLILSLVRPVATHRTHHFRGSPRIAHCYFFASTNALTNSFANGERRTFSSLPRSNSRLKPSELASITKVRPRSGTLMMSEELPIHQP